ncbi:SPOSA6832_03450 [Sporobolomyces salmonicolor]|uniref:SPOSA6832_03450-mRNA-1:cds n=1 Tax=Sporidiobolus salmonicolor TaxID=5005 RepID=A0A0D6ENT3_SPOSA|nr:SPOSA6832_03450 [Sporobolomyces salmonicolor]
MPRLEVLIGPDRFHLETAWVNHTDKPTEIDTPSFTGRVLMLVRDFSGVTPDGSEPKRDCVYFQGRSRKFAILIEGKFKRREGHAPYTGEEVQFGTDFGPFNAGMKVARWVDPATYYETKPPSGRPFIMSPYIACSRSSLLARNVGCHLTRPSPSAVNTFWCALSCSFAFPARPDLRFSASAYPGPDVLSKAIVLFQHDSAHPHHDGEEEGSFVPAEEISPNKHKWVERQHWRFAGLLGEARVDEFVATHSHLFLPSSSSSTPAHTDGSSASTPASDSTRSMTAAPSMNRHPSSLILGTIPKDLAPHSSEPDSPVSDVPTNDLTTPSTDNVGPRSSSAPETPAPAVEPIGRPSMDESAVHGWQWHWGAPIPNQQSQSQPAPSSATSASYAPNSKEGKPSRSAKEKKRSRFSLATLRGALEKEENTAQSLSSSIHLMMADQLPRAVDPLGLKRQASGEKYKPKPEVESELGPWRFADETVDVAEDTTFVFLDPDHPRTVSQRRKHFCANDGKNRKEFTYHPDMMGPVNLNIASHFTKMPIRYTLRSTRMVPRPDGEGIEREEETFVTISIRLVD